MQPPNRSRSRPYVPHSPLLTLYNRPLLPADVPIRRRQRKTLTPLVDYNDGKALKLAKRRLGGLWRIPAAVVPLFQDELTRVNCGDQKNKSWRGKGLRKTALYSVGGALSLKM